MSANPQAPARPHHSGPVLELRNLVKKYPSRHHGPPHVVLKGISIKLEPGQCLGLVGESGSGKSTIARILAGLEQPTNGEVIVGGSNLKDSRQGTLRRRQHAKTVQMVFQDPNSSLDPLQTIGSALEEVLALHAPGARSHTSRVEELLNMVGLDAETANAKPAALSGGQRQRAAIARALAAEPDAIILDEAVAALDVSIQAQIINLLVDLREKTGTAYLFITHDLAVVRQLADTIVVLRHGEIAEEGAAESVLDTPRSPYTRQLRDSVPRPGWTPTRTTKRAQASA